MNEPSHKLNRIRTMLAEGKPSFGLLNTIPGPQSVQILASAGVDWLIIDMEHAPIDFATAHAMILATSGTQTVPFVRIPWSYPWQSKTVMDLGAMGIVFPMITTAAQAQAAVRSVRYPPDGDRLWGPFYAPMRWNQPMASYIRVANDNML